MESKAEKPKPVLSLVRVSGIAQVDRKGIPRQQADIRDYCQQFNLEVIEDGKYTFPGLSGASVEKNPKFREMLRRLASKQIYGLVLSDISRFFRPEFLDQYSLTKVFREHHKHMICDKGDLDFHVPKDQDIFDSAAKAAGEYRRNIKKWTQGGKKIRRLEGDCPSETLPIGVHFVEHPKSSPYELTTGHFEYRNDAAAFTVTIHGKPTTIGVCDRIKLAFERVKNGYSQSEVARGLCFGSPQGLRRNLQSYWWIGEKFVQYQRVWLKKDGTPDENRMTDDGKPIRGVNRPNTDAKPVKADFAGAEPLVDRETFFTVQAILKDNNKRWAKRKTAAANRLNSFVGHGLVFCGTCGEPLYPNGSGKYTYYVCATKRQPTKTPCGHPTFTQAVVDKNLMDWCYAWLKGPRPASLFEKEDSTPKVNVPLIEKELAKLNTKKTALYSKIGDPDFDQTMLNTNIRNVQSQIGILTEQLNAANSTVQTPIDVMELRANVIGAIIDGSPEQKAEVLRKYFKKFVIGTKGFVKGVVLASGHQWGQEWHISASSNPDR